MWAAPATCVFLSELKQSCQNFAKYRELSHLINEKFITRNIVNNAMITVKDVMFSKCSTFSTFLQSSEKGSLYSFKSWQRNAKDS